MPSSARSGDAASTARATRTKRRIIGSPLPTLAPSRNAIAPPGEPRTVSASKERNPERLEVAQGAEPRAVLLAESLGRDAGSRTALAQPEPEHFGELGFCGD